MKKLLINLGILFALFIIICIILYATVEAMFIESTLYTDNPELLDRKIEFAETCENSPQMSDKNYAEYCKYMKRYIDKD